MSFLMSRGSILSFWGEDSLPQEKKDFWSIVIEKSIENPVRNFGQYFNNKEARKKVDGFTLKLG